jgi:hypothetical protein
MASLAALAATLPLREAAGALTVIASAAVAVRLHRLHGRDDRSVILSTSAIAVAGIGVVAAPHLPWNAPASMIVALVLTAIMAAPPRPGDLPAGDHATTHRSAVALGTLFAACFCLYGLQRPELPFVWEPEVFQGFDQALRSETSFVGFVSERLGWGWGLVSTSWDTLIWGPLTYAVFLAGEVSPLGQRVVGAGLAVLVVPAIFVAGRLVGGRSLGATAAVMASVHPMVLFYGRYGIALSATLLFLVLSLAACLWAVAQPRRPILAGSVAAVALAGATFGYAPARASVIALAAVLVIRLAVTAPPVWRVLIPVLIVFTALVLFQASRGEVFRFAHGRGEQLWSMMNHDYLVAMHVGEPGPEGHRHLDVAGHLIARTVPEAAEVLARPLHPELEAARIAQHDPPWLPLVPTALVPFALLGLGRSLRTLRSPSTQFLIALCAVVAPMVLTTRIDAHRLMALAIPLTVWSAEGTLVFLHWLHTAGAPRWLRGILLASLIGLAGLHTSGLIRSEIGSPGALPELRATVERSLPPVLMIVDGDHRLVGGVRMAITRRWIASGRTDRSGIMKAEHVAALRSGSPAVARTLPALLRSAESRVLVFFPEAGFREVGERLAAQGFRITPFETGSGPGFTARRVE